MRSLLLCGLAAAALLTSGAEAHKHDKHVKHGKGEKEARSGHKDKKHGHWHGKHEHKHELANKAFDLADYPCTDMGSCLHSWHKLEHRM